MRLPTWLVTALACVAPFTTPAAALASSSPSAPPDGLLALDGEWTYVEDRTEGRALERLGPPMSTTFVFRIEEDAVILVRGHGSGHRDVRIALDGSTTEVTGPQKITRYHATWGDDALTYEVNFLRGENREPGRMIRRQFRITPDGLLVRARSGPTGFESVALYRHAEDIALPTPADAAIDDLAWLAGAWVGTRGKSSIDERWTPPLGGSMLAVSRTVSRARDRMVAFEYLRIIERDGGLVYIAQPNGGSPTEFTLTELSATRAVFDNPRHDYPKRIVYELSADGALSATIGFMKGGTPRQFEFTREGD